MKNYLTTPRRQKKLKKMTWSTMRVLRVWLGSQWECSEYDLDHYESAQSLTQSTIRVRRIWLGALWEYSECGLEHYESAQNMTWSTMRVLWIGLGPLSECSEYDLQHYESAQNLTRATMRVLRDWLGALKESLSSLRCCNIGSPFHCSPFLSKLTNFTSCFGIFLVLYIKKKFLHCTKSPYKMKQQLCVLKLVLIVKKNPVWCFWKLCTC